jgi:hypothetical protein
MGNSSTANTLETGAPENEIEITPEMVTAGSDAVSEFWTSITDPQSDLSIVPLLVIAIYKAMEAERVSPRL